MKVYAILSDIQIPWQDVPVLELVLRFIEDLQPDGIVLNGDIVDCYSISSHRRLPAMLTQSGLNREIDQCQQLMSRLSYIRYKWYLGGNHENRFANLIADRAPELGLLPGIDFQTVFGLGEHGFTWREYGDYIMLGKLLVTHGDIVRKHSAYSAKAHFDKFGVSVLHGHTHRLGSYYHSNVGGPNGAWENGCLCRLDGLGYTKHPDWQHGFSVVHVEPNGLFNVTNIPVLRRKQLFYGGRVWRR